MLVNASAIPERNGSSCCVSAFLLLSCYPNPSLASSSLSHSSIIIIHSCPGQFYNTRSWKFAKGGKVVVPIVLAAFISYLLSIVIVNLFLNRAMLRCCGQ